MTFFSFCLVKSYAHAFELAHSEINLPSNLIKSLKQKYRDLSNPIHIRPAFLLNPVVLLFINPVLWVDLPPPHPFFKI